MALLEYGPFPVGRMRHRSAISLVVSVSSKGNLLFYEFIVRRGIEAAQLESIDSNLMIYRSRRLHFAVTFSVDFFFRFRLMRLQMAAHLVVEQKKSGENHSRCEMRFNVIISFAPANLHHIFCDQSRFN